MAIDLNISKSVQTRAKLAVIVAAVTKLTGEPPIIENKGDHYYIDFTVSQKKKIQDYFLDILRSEPSEIRFNFAGTLLPPLIKAYGKYLAITHGAAYMLGKI